MYRAPTGGWLRVFDATPSEREARNIAYALGVVAVWHLLSQERGEHWLEDRLRDAGLWNESEVT